MHESRCWKEKSMRSTIPLLFALVFSGCSHLQPRPQACLAQPPPVVAEAVELEECPDMSNLTICMDQKNAKKLAAYLAHSVIWMDEAWTRCGPREK
jgi:hypothetical protein